MKNHSNLDNSAPILPIWEQGVLLAERREGFHTFRLFELEGTYVEVTQHTHFNVVLRVASFRDPKHLDPYLDAISLEGLFPL
ncbi:MAG: hypothetical protein EOO11_05080 [Chitinophagaceae bacterium]|nr:MAG: hypothetical protein EOO11_05080 [Chitinophagaceae bacterium]